MNQVAHELMVPALEHKPHLLTAVKRALAQHGVPGFTIHPALGTWTDDDGTEYPDEPMHHIVADVEDTPEMDDLFSRLGEAIAHEGEQQVVYHRKTPVQISLHPPAQHPDLDLSGASAPDDQFTASIFS